MRINGEILDSGKNVGTKLALSQEILRTLTSDQRNSNGGKFLTRVGPICSTDSFNGCCL